jgi:hypothetical protein
VVVPDHDLRDLGVEAPQVLVLEVVEVVAAVLVERLGDLRLRGVTRLRQSVPSSSVSSGTSGLSA